MLIHSGGVVSPPVPTTLFQGIVGADVTFDPQIVADNAVTIDWDFGGGAANIQTTGTHNVSVALSGGAPYAVTASTTGDIGTFFDFQSPNDGLISVTTIDPRARNITLNGNAIASFPDETLLINLNNFIMSNNSNSLTRAFDLSNAVNINLIDVGIAGFTDFTFPVVPSLSVLGYPGNNVGNKVFTGLTGLTSLSSNSTGQTECIVDGLTNLQTLICSFQATLTNVSCVGCTSLNQIRFNTCSVPATTIDAILAQLVANGVNGGTYQYQNQSAASGSGHLDANRSAQGIADIATLGTDGIAGRGWTRIGTY